MRWRARNRFPRSVSLCRATFANDTERRKTVQETRFPQIRIRSEIIDRLLEGSKSNIDRSRPHLMIFGIRCIRDTHIHNGRSSCVPHDPQLQNYPQVQGWTATPTAIDTSLRCINVKRHNTCGTNRDGSISRRQHACRRISLFYYARVRYHFFRANRTEEFTIRSTHQLNSFINSSVCSHCVTRFTARIKNKSVTVIR